MTVPKVSSLVSLAEMAKEAIRSFGKGLTRASEKTAVVAVHLFESIAHAVVGAPLALLAGRQQRAKLHLDCAKIALYCLYAYSLPRENPYSEEFRFHHISYGLFFMLLPGRFHEFGKWMTFDSLVNYDQFAVFKWREGKFFSKIGGTYTLQAGRSDGTLEQISSVTIRDKATRVDERAFPADNFFVRNYTKLFKEMFMPWKEAAYLDTVIAKKNQIIDEVVLPDMERIKNDPSRRKPKISGDLSLFK
jgi:hypothetical protein